MFRRNKKSENREILLQAFYNLEDRLTRDLEVDDTILAFTATDNESRKMDSIYIIANHLADEDERILVIDANLRADELEEIKSFYNKRGLVDCLLGDFKVDDVLVRDRDNLHLLMTGRVNEYEDMYLEPSSISSFFQDLKDRYDYIFINTKENIGIAEANVFCALADKTVIFCTEENSKSYLLEESISQLKKAGADIKGVVISDYVYAESELDDLFGGN
ncbi:AAA family ATPase [uncultured Anaerococcus sp.]|uniref:tyrosine-protein kinase family protein n=1 Tax=uncultured Anaerococcus sp. TaxID=293428 RepID=UPI0025EFF963|nr:AAA family ATPase [uncultured Anaerococcus sp.]